MDLEKEANKMADFISSMMIRDGEVMPIFILHGGGAINFMPIQAHSEQSKKDSVTALKKAVQMLNIHTVFSVVESWVVTQKGYDINNLPRPSVHPDKEEAVVINGQNKDGEILVQVYMIKRDKNGAFDSLVYDAKHSEGITKIEGIFTNYFTMSKDENDDSIVLTTQKMPSSKDADNNKTVH